MSQIRPLSVLALVLLLSFAGCADKKDDGDDAGSSSTQSSTGAGSGLIAVIRVLSNGTAATPVNGSIPAQAGVELTFDGSNSTGAVLEYAWDFGDNTTGTDETETHAFASGGLYNVTLTVKGLGNASANATIRIDVAADLAGQPLFTDAQSFEGDLPLANPNSCTNQGIDCQDHVVTILAADANGTPALAKKVLLILDGSGATAVHMQLFWRGPDGTVLNSTAASGLDHTLEYAGDMPAGEYVARVRLFVGAQASYSLAVAVEYVHA